ncbi:MAG TPA: hypothetical protein VLQ91_20200 [Draconibacterium sp.]|nr:hypothetical protein [Draconibacterium sp.]
MLLITQFIGIPLLKMLHVLKPIDLKATTNIIQKHFTGIEDKLLNIIELNDLPQNQYSNELILASIDQKIEQLKVFDFNDAVQFKNVKYVIIYLLISVLVSLGIFVFNKNVFIESTNRLVHFNTTFVKPAPFTFKLENSELKVKKGDSYLIKVLVEGDVIPEIVYINIEGNNYLMKTSAAGLFEFEMISVINPVQFYFTDLKYKSDKYDLQLLPKPGITQFKTTIFPPAYTGLQSQVLDNIGDLQIPNGTKVEWSFNGIDIDSVFVMVGDSVKINAIELNNGFDIESKFYNSANYNVYIQNEITQPELALSYSIEVIPDLFPEIEIVQMIDSLQLTRYYFKGIIGDDYGFSDLSFHYNIDNTDSAITIPFVKMLTDQEFYFVFDFKELNQIKGIVSYYFSVSDNDVINNYKTTTSDNYTFEFPDRDEILASDKEQFDALQTNIDKSRELAKEIKQDLNNLQLKNMDTNVSEWEKSQMVSDIISKQNKLEHLYNQIKQDNENLNKYLNSFDKQNQAIQEKQKQIEELLEEVFTDELKKLMEEFNKLADEFNSQKLNQLSEDMNLTFEDLEKQLEKNLEMLRKMKVEQKLQNVIDQVNEIAKEEEKLAKEFDENKNFEEAEEKVSSHQEQTKQLEKEIKDALELNKELKKPMNFDDFDEEFKDVDKSFEESKSELNKKNKKKSGENIKKSGEKLQNMAFGMQQMLDMNTKQQNMENIANLKQILSNLIFLSFSQEKVLSDLNGIADKDPALFQLNKDQKRIFEQSKIVKDSLYTLAMRTPQITSMVNNELLAMEINLKKANEEMQEALFPNARVSQQFVVTSLNNLALMLNEALENLEEQMANAQPGDQECENPGNGKSGMNSLKQASESIKQQLQQMIEQMKNGNSQNMSKQMGQSLMQHEMMQQMLRDMMNNGSVGSDAKKQLQQIDNMLEQNRKELMNKSINAQTIARQNQITTRLLEAEKAELERDFEDKRESETADEFYSNPIKFFEYKERDNFSIEYLNKNSHKLHNFYNNKYKQYLKNIDIK